MVLMVEDTHPQFILMVIFMLTEEHSLKDLMGIPNILFYKVWKKQPLLIMVPLERLILLNGMFIITRVIGDKNHLILKQNLILKLMVHQYLVV